MYEFRASQRLGIMIFMVSRMTQSIWKGCRSSGTSGALEIGWCLRTRFPPPKELKLIL